MPDPVVNDLINLLASIATHPRAVCYTTIKERALNKKNLRISSQMITRLCRLGYIRLEPVEDHESKYQITNDGLILLNLPLFERHTEFLHRKEKHPEGRKCYICGYSGPGITRFQKRDYCEKCLNSEYKPEYDRRECSSLAWEV